MPKTPIEKIKPEKIKKDPKLNASPRLSPSQQVLIAPSAEGQESQSTDNNPMSGGNNCATTFILLDRINSPTGSGNLLKYVFSRFYKKPFKRRPKKNASAKLT